MASKKQEAQASKRGQTQQSKVSDRSIRMIENRRTSHPVLQLQRQVGNAAVTQAIQRRQDSPPQAKQGRIQREEDDGLWDTLLRGGGQLMSGDFGGGAETFSESESIDQLGDDALDFFGGLLGF